MIEKCLCRYCPDNITLELFSQFLSPYFVINSVDVLGKVLALVTKHGGEILDEPLLEHSDLGWQEKSSVIESSWVGGLEGIHSSSPDRGHGRGWGNPKSI